MYTGSSTISTTDDAAVASTKKTAMTKNIRILWLRNRQNLQKHTANVDTIHVNKSKKKNIFCSIKNQYANYKICYPLAAKRNPYSHLHALQD